MGFSHVQLSGQDRALAGGICPLSAAQRPLPHAAPETFVKVNLNGTFVYSLETSPLHLCCSHIVFHFPWI